MPPTPDETCGADAPARGPRGPFDEARLLTIGQAADLLGVAHVTLRQWARAGRIATQPGRKGGLEVDLVRAGDLAALDPRVRQRGLPEASVVELAGAAPGVRMGDQGRTSAAGRAVLPLAGTASGEGASAEWARELACEVERLRAELASERARGRSRALELGAVERDLRRLLAAPRTSTEGPSSDLAAAVVQAAPIGANVDDVHVGRAPRRGVPLLALLPALVLGFVARPWLLAPAQPEVQASDAQQSGHARSATALTAGTFGAALLEAAPSGVAAAPSAVAAEISTSSLAPADRQRGAQGDMQSDSSALTQTEEHAPTQPGADLVDSAGAGDFQGRLTASEIMPLAYAAVAGTACAFGGHAADLGPCMGPATLTGEAIAGTHRVDGIDCCHHHQLAQRLGGDLAELAATAELARQEGVLPPLVAARIDRAVGQFLRARFGAWRAAGVDDAQSEEHRVQLTAEGRATVETWVERVQDNPLGATPEAASPRPRVERRELRLVLEVSDGAEGDVLLELVTLTCSTEVAAGAAVAEPGADQSIAGTGQ